MIGFGYGDSAPLWGKGKSGPNSLPVYQSCQEIQGPGVILVRDVDGMDAIVKPPGKDLRRSLTRTAAGPLQTILLRDALKDSGHASPG